MKYKKIYFIGIKGVGMAPLAIIAKQAGFKVCGSDIFEEFITDKALSSEGIKIDSGFEEKDIDRFIGNSKKEEILVIATAAHGGFDNPQAKYAKEKGFELLSQGEALGVFMKGEMFGRSDICGISVAGSHGKTTISAMVACFLSKLRLDPSYSVGTSEIFPIGASGHYGKGKYFVCEADEYLSEPNYDRTAKFLYQEPKIAIFNNIDFDHPDFYKDIDDIENAFYEFANKMKDGGILIIDGDDSRLLNIKNKLNESIKVITYGFSKDNDYYLTKTYESGFDTYFSVESKDIKLGEFCISIPGRHNAKNALSAIALLIEIGISIDKIKEVLPSFKGTKRRFEVIGETLFGATIIDDYAHHPAEIKATILALKNVYPNKNIVCIFQPHTSSRTEALFSDFTSSFFGVDNLIIIPVFASQRKAGESEFSSEKLIDGLKALGKNALFLKNEAIVLEYVNNNFATSDNIIITMGAGDVYKIAYSLKK